jgi:hypothetical protein
MVETYLLLPTRSGHDEIGTREGGTGSFSQKNFERKDRLQGRKLMRNPRLTQKRCRTMMIVSMSTATAAMRFLKVRGALQRFFHLNIFHERCRFVGRH